VPATPRQRRARARWTLAGVLGLLFALLVQAPASAHAQLVSTDPAQGSVLTTAPATVTLTFNEHVIPVDEHARLFGPSGKEMQAPATGRDRAVIVKLPGDLADGTWIVSWRVLSADGHPVAGSLSFSIGAPSEGTAAPSGEAGSSTTLNTVRSVLQGLAYVGVLLAAGLLVFLIALLEPGEDAVRRRLARVCLAAAAVGVVSSALLVPVTGALQEGTGLPGVLQTAVLLGQGAAGRWLDFAAVPLGLGLGLAALRRPGRTWQRLGLLGAAAAPASFALAGHSRSAGPGAVVIAADVAHALAGAVWLGGLVGLALLVRRIGVRPSTVAVTVSRFSALAGGTLGVVAVTGLLMAWRIVGSWAALTGTAYGLVLLAKIFAVAVVAAVAGWNRWNLMPRLAQAVGSGDVARLLRRTIRVEAAIICVILAFTGVLVGLSPLPPASSSVASDSPVNELHGELGENHLMADISPGRPGSNVIDFWILDAAGSEIIPAADPVVSVRSGNVDLGSHEVRRGRDGGYHLELVIPRGGSWTLQASVRFSTYANPVALIPFEVSE
jgi:copper transport protein